MQRTPNAFGVADLGDKLRCFIHPSGCLYVMAWLSIPFSLGQRQHKHPMGEWSDYFEDFPEENPANYDEQGRYNPGHRAESERLRIANEKVDAALRRNHAPPDQTPHSKGLPRRSPNGSPKHQNALTFNQPSLSR
jgi:hypothetical protein